MRVARRAYAFLMDCWEGIRSLFESRRSRLALAAIMWAVGVACLWWPDVEYTDEVFGIGMYCCIVSALIIYLED